VRRLLREKQPGFAAALELAERQLLGQPGREPPTRRGRDRRQRHHRCLPEGPGWPDLNIAEARRQSSADASLTPVLHRPNLAQVTGALAHRVRVQRGAPQVHRRLPPRGRPARSTDPTLPPTAMSLLCMGL
jgi:hypothetical protein